MLEYGEMDLFPPLEALWLPSGIEVLIQRDDLIHPLVSGNKWRKLKGWIREAESSGIRLVITFGGAFSNHMIASASSCRLANLKCVVAVRGEEAMENHYLDVAKQEGAITIGIERSIFKDRGRALECLLGKLLVEHRGWVIRDLGLDLYFALQRFLDVEGWKDIDWDFGYKGDGFLVIPEGGKGERAFIGFEELVEWWKGIGIKPWIFHASATGTTAVGLVKAFEKLGLDYRLSSVLVLKNIEEQKAYFDRFVQNQLLHGFQEFLLDYTFGGYAKTTDELFGFIQKVMDENPDQMFDPIYTAKALFAMNQLLSNNAVCMEEEGLVPIFLHTGGQLGGFSEKFAGKGLLGLI
jgi:1-aminocyclopropane-1-carboxylate deaminase